MILVIDGMHTAVTTVQVEAMLKGKTIFSEAFSETLIYYNVLEFSSCFA